METKDITTEDIEKAIEQLPPRELARFRAWFEAFDAGQFDAAIERDARAGRLDGFAEEASAERRAGIDRGLRDIAEIGKRRYASIKETLERDHFGAHVMINTDTSDYIVAPTLLQVHTAFIERFGGDAPCWSTRIGVSLFAIDAIRFDAAIERDARAGKLDALAEEALAEHRASGSREL
jgi:hypothetical protein